MVRIRKHSRSNDLELVITICALAIVAVVFVCYYAMLFLSRTQVTALRLTPGLILVPLYLYWRYRSKER